MFSRGIARIPHLTELTGARSIVFRPSPAQAAEIDVVVGWGHKPTARRARDFAMEHARPYVGLEDGFLRSANVGLKGPPLSLVLDDVGIYYDATRPSRLEQWLASPDNEDPLVETVLLRRAAACRTRIVEAGLCKYNHALGELPAWFFETKRPRVLVVDQTRADASIALGHASEKSFERMLEAALGENPDATVVVKTHPDVWTDRKRCHLTESTGRARLLGEAVDPAKLLDAVDQVYVVTSGLGFEALLRQLPVTCFGTPFYAGWGLTDDRVSTPRRGARRSLDQLVAAALILYPRYVEPVTGKRCEVEGAIEHLALQRAMFQKNRGTHYCFGFTAWKHHYVRRYLESPAGRVVFASSVGQARRRGIDARSRIVVWGTREPPGLAELGREFGVGIQHMEDGFLRSVGLGSDFTAPASLVLDGRGMYYDPRHPSDLEHLLLTADFSPDELSHARALRQRIVELRISKYNFTPSVDSLTPPSGRRVLLVPGQVEDDASVLCGSPRLKNNQELLEEVRRLNPEAHIVYKIHPDVVSGNRVGGRALPRGGLYDELVERTPIDRCLDVAEEVHTMTSLVGFEALLRGLRVVCYGQPFYAGWGLTEDMEPIARRTRRLTLDELVAGALIRYPRYYSYRARTFTSAERIADELGEARAKARAEQPAFHHWAMRQWRRGVTLLKGVLDAG